MHTYEDDVAVPVKERKGNSEINGCRGAVIVVVQNQVSNVISMRVKLVQVHSAHVEGKRQK